MPKFVTVVHPDIAVTAVVAESALPHLAGWRLADLADADEPPASDSTPPPDVPPNDTNPAPAAPADGDDSTPPTPEPPAPTTTETES